MFEEYQICPYTGLRSFTEEESLYFKGREEHIEQATEQLQRNKFLMLTGASGDGKSSLIYAGIVPNARAGFLKSKYTQWNVADFRPERSPFKNLCRVLAKQLEIANPATVESELQHGFSALIDLYKNSKCYIDVDSVEWQQADDAEKAVLKRHAANLIIIVDQFEEFFTNPENYHHGVPSRDSNLVLNVLLETARIALEEDLPIYIVFTMRSDYIGQCAAFRSLPEYIGFSQFFVPRLNRSQLEQVIEKPATLSGNQISRRLTERLIHDISEGVDQLPILQHALNQIWHAANQGNDEMDLIHYAMVGGMPPSELPDDQVDNFTQWFSRQHENIKRFYEEPNLQNVLDTHANKLYESAAESYRSKTGKVLSDEVAKEIIKTAFTCLTKIDQSRAVRNRMTLKEIYNILSRGDVDVDTVGWVLNIFREPGNTFVRPFITEDPESGVLHEDDVLDITHESLIRNWELLEQWAKEEFNNYTISLDFEQQIARWVESGKSGGFLLSIGPLTYFENWYNNVKPNIHWIARYLPEGEKQQQKLNKASLFLSNAREFLKRSTRKHLVTRTIVVYGPRRIAAILAVIGLLILSSFGVTSYIQRKNSFVLEKIKDESILLGGSRKVAVEDKAILLCENVRLGLTTIPEIAKGIDEPMERINAIASMATAMIVQGWHQPEKEIYQTFAVVDSLLENIPVSLTTPNYSEILRESNELMVTLDLGHYFNPTEKMSGFVNRNAKRIATWLMLIAKEKPMQFTDIRTFDQALEHAINHHALNVEETNQLLSLLSPFESAEMDEWVRTKFARDIISERGWFNYGLAFNGLYQELAYLYASLGNTSKTLMCLDTLLKHNQKYFQNDYSNMPDHAGHLAATFYQYNQLSPMDEFVKEYCIRKKITEVEFYKILLGHNRISVWAVARVNYWPQWNKFTNPILLLSDESQQTFFFKKYRSALQKIYKADERNFYTALSYKDQAIYKDMLVAHKRINGNENQINSWFDSAFYYYNRVSSEFVEQKVQMYYNSESRPLKYLFLFPDFNTQNFPSEPRGGFFYFSSTCFMDYILTKRLIDVVYPTDVELGYIADWLIEYRLTLINSGFGVISPMDGKTLSRLEKEIRPRKTANQNFDELYLLLGNEIAPTNSDSAAFFYKQADETRIANITGESGNFGMLITAIAVSNLAKLGEFNEAYRFVQAFKKPVNRSTLYGFAAQQLQRNTENSSVVNQLIDSARAEMIRVENTGADQQSRLHLPYALAMRLENNDLNEAEKIIKNVSFKFFVKETFSRSLAFHGKLFESYENIPENVSDADRTVFLWNALYGYSEGQREQTNYWNQYNKNHRWWYARFITYNNEDN